MIDRGIAQKMSSTAQRLVLKHLNILPLAQYLLAVTLETTHKSAKPPTKHRNCPQSTQKPPKPAKSKSNYPKTTQTTHKPPKSSANYPQTSRTTHKVAITTQLFSRKTVFYVTKNNSNNAKHLLSFQPCHYINV